MKRTSLLAFAVVASGCIFSSSDGPPDDTQEPDAAANNGGTNNPVSDVGGQNNGAPDMGGPPTDMAVDPPDLDVPDVPPSPTACLNALRPELLPTSVVPGGESITSDLNFAAFENRLGNINFALGFRTESGVHARILRTDGNSVTEVAEPPPAFDTRETLDLASGRREGGEGLDIALTRDRCNVDGSGSFLSVLAEGGDLPIEGSCPGPIWGLEYAGGYRQFTGTMGDPQRVVFFEGGSATSSRIEIVSLPAPYTADRRRAALIAEETGAYSNGWIETSSGPVVVFSDGESMSAWETTTNDPPASLGPAPPRRLFGLAAVAGNNYVVARPTDGGVVRVQYWSWVSNRRMFEDGPIVEDIPVADVQAVDVATFRGGFAVFVQDSRSTWTVRTYRIGPGGVEASCAMNYAFGDIFTQDVELIAYEDGDALQVVAAVHFRIGSNGQDQINVEGPRWPFYFR